MGVDYRNPVNTYLFSNVENEKNKLKLYIKSVQPRLRNYYRNMTNTDYRTRFIKIYNNRCAYCGISTEIIDIDTFEIDHFICESSFSNKTEAGKLENLVLACKRCNRRKSDFSFGSISKKFNPSDNSIAKLYSRDALYNITIKDNNKKVKEFYTHLEFNSQKRRLDYLIMEMQLLASKMPNNMDLSKLILFLLNKRNNWKE